MKRLALKVDCDTYEGTKAGIPNLLKLFVEFDIQASFFFTLGPDRTGRAIARVFTRKGFLKKMLRANAVSLYGPKTLLYGTLLPAPMIGQRLKEVIHSVHTAGHDVGVHSWDHVRWHDKLDRMTEAEIEKDYGQAHQTFAKIFGFKARSSAAAGWHVTAGSLRVQQKYDLLYTSDTRQGGPFFPSSDGTVFPTLEIPSTLPTWDEALGDPRFFKSKKQLDETAFVAHYQNLIKGTEVHSIHTEVEGTAKLLLFRRQILAWRNDKVKFVTLEQIANEQLTNRAQVPERRLERMEIPFRNGLVTGSR